MKTKRFLFVSLCLSLLAVLFAVPVLAADNTLTLREDWRLTSDLDLNVAASDTLTIDGNGYYIYELGGKLVNNGAGTVIFAKGTIVYEQGGTTPGDMAKVSQAAASADAQAVTVANPAKGADKLTLPTVNGVKAAIRSSSRPDVIDLDGNITAPSSSTSVQLALALSSDDGKVLAELKTVTVTVPGTGSGGVYIAPDDEEEKPEPEPQPERPFTDVTNPKTWYYDAVYYGFDKGYFAGVSETEFAPGTTMTRAMFVTVLYNMAGKPEVTATKSFPDVAAGKWYSDGVLWGASKGIISGYPDGNFGPTDSVTREQMAVLFWNYAGKPTATADLSKFSDADKISTYAKAAMNWAVSVGIINGKGNGILDPKSSATRAEVAQIVQNYDMKVEK